MAAGAPFGLSPAQFAEVLRDTDFGCWCWDRAADTVAWLGNWCESHDIDPCVGDHHRARWNTQVHPEDRATVAAFQDAVAGRIDAYEIEYRLRTRSGGWRWILSRARIVARDDAGRTLQIGGVIIDIHARKTTELALRATEARLEAALGGTGIGVWESRIEGRFHWLNDWCTALGIDPCDREDGSAQWRTLIHPEDLEPYDRQIEACRTGRAAHYAVEYRIRTSSGRWHWLHERGTVLAYNASAPTVQFVGFCIDIDARKQMEAALQTAALRYEASIRAAELPVWEYDVRADLVRGNLHWRRITDPHATEQQARAHAETWLSHVHPEDQPVLARTLAECSRDGKASFEVEFRIRTPAGRYRWQLDRGRVIEWDAGGAPTKLIGISIDIDARKRTELALHTQAMILETVQEGVVLLDAAGRIEFTNAAFDRLFRRQNAELAGTSAIDLLKPRSRLNASRLSIDRLLRRFGARTAGRQVELRRGDGSCFAAEVLMAGIEMHGENKTLCVIQDVSERKRLEREVAEATHQERQRLGIDLHDGLGQELTGIALLLRGLAQAPELKESAAKPRLDEIIGLVNHAVDGARTMASGLSPIRLAPGGLVSALRSLSEWSQASYGIRVVLRFGLRAEMHLDEAGATHLYLIAQEAIVNAATHGRSRQVIVKLRVSRELISLSADDDGVGLGAAPRRSARSGMGLKIMQYRAGAVGGMLQVKRRRNGGTQVRCVCPNTLH